jgi:uncharacterized membrane protein YtjA (UPF0391 family)
MLSMVRFVIGLLVLAGIAALFGFGGMGEYSWEGARKFVYVFLVLAGITFIFGSGAFRRLG